MELQKIDERFTDLIFLCITGHEANFKYGRVGWLCCVQRPEKNKPSLPGFEATLKELRGIGGRAEKKSSLPGFETTRATKTTLCWVVRIYGQQIDIVTQSLKAKIGNIGPFWKTDLLPLKEVWINFYPLSKNRKH